MELFYLPYRLFIAQAVQLGGRISVSHKIFFIFLVFPFFFCTSILQAQVTLSGAAAATPNGNYATLTAACAAINLTPQNGLNLQIGINSNTTETGATLNAGTWNSVHIFPTTPGITVTGATSATPILILNGADSVTLDGRVNQAGSMNLVLTKPSSTSVIRLVNDAKNNIITYCRILGPTTTNGVIAFGTSAAGGNDNNIISYCNIGPSTGSSPTYLIYSLGSSLINDNSNNTILNCNLSNFYSSSTEHAGIFLNTNNSAWTIDGNSIYQTASYGGPGTFVAYGIYIKNAGNNYSIRNNFIGGKAPFCSGGKWTTTGINAYTFIGILLDIGTGSNIVENNTIKEFDWSTGSSAGSTPSIPGVWCGILNQGSGNVTIGNPGNGNKIGDNSTGSVLVTASASGATVFGIGTKSTGITIIQYNSIGSITSTGSSTNRSANLVGIQAENGTNLIDNNNVGIQGTANSLNCLTASTNAIQFIRGIVFNNGVTAVNTNQTITNNYISNLNNNYNGGTAGPNRGISIEPGSGAFTGSVIINGNTISGIQTSQNLSGTLANTNIAGIHISAAATSGVTISGNTIYSLSATGTTAAVNVAGIYYNGPITGTNSVSKNFIYNLSTPNTTSTSAAVYGIRSNAGTTTYSNNIISLGSATNKAQIFGFNDGGGSNNIYHNTVSITGNSSVNVTDAALNTTTNNTRNIRNNIFYTNRAGSGVHRSVSILFTSALTISYNDYSGGLSGITLNVAPDNNSTSINPALVNPSGANLSDYLPGIIESASLMGTNTLLGSIPDDIDATTRCVPTMGAQENSSVPSTPGPITGTGTLCSGLTGQVYSISAVTFATTYTWTVPSGWSITAGQGTISVTATSGGSGIGQITVTAGNACGTSAVSSMNVTVNPAPTVTNAAGYSTCSGTSPNIALNSSIPGSTFSWIIGTNPGGITGGSAGSGNTINQVLTNPSNSVTNTIQYIVTSTSPAGCVGPTYTINVSVDPLPTVNALGPFTYCSGSAVPAINFVSSIGGSSFAWTSDTDIGFGTSGGGSIPSFTASNASLVPIIATVTVTATAAGCAGIQRNFTITMNPTPSASIETNYCIVPGQIQLTASPGPAPTYSYLWNTGSPAYTSQVITVNVAGIYGVVVTNSYGCSSTALSTIAVEMVANGNFTAGNTGFTSDYTYWPDIAGNNELVPDNGTNGYSVGTNGQNFHPNFWGQDHSNNTVGPRNFMLVNGHGSLKIWRETLNVTVNTDYYFSAWAISLNSAGPYANLRFSINGAQVGTTTGPLPPRPQNNNPPFNWIQFYGNWNSGDSTTALLEIVDLETAAGGNDFGLDDISFGSLSPASSVASPSANGGGVVCEGGTLNLTSNISGGIPPYSYSWSGPNSFSSNVANPVISPVTSSAAGTYWVSVSDGYNCPPTPVSVTVSVTPSPISPISATVDRNNFCENDAGDITLTAIGGSGNTLNWYTGSCGGTLVGAGVSLVIPSPTVTTTYYARWESACGSPTCANVTVSVLTQPSPPTSVSATPNPVCAGANLTLTATGGSGGSGSNPVLNWYSGSCGGTLVGTGTPLTIPAPSTNTTYYARWENGCGASACLSVLVNINPLPVAPTSATFDRLSENICEDDAGNITLIATGGAGNTLTWYSGSCGGAFAGTGTSLTIPSPTISTTYYASWSNGCGPSACASILVTILPLPIAPTSASASPNPVCAGVGNISLTVTGGSGTTVRWLTGSCTGTSVGTGNPITIPAPLVATTYYARWENGCGNSSCASVLVNLQPQPVAFNVTGGGQYCSGGSGSAVGLSGSESGVTYQLLLGGVPVPGAVLPGTGAAISFGNQTTGTYTVTATFDSPPTCMALMTGSAIISIFTLNTSYTVTGGGTICSGGPGVNVGLSNWQPGVRYELYINGIPTGNFKQGPAPINFGLQTIPGTYTVVATKITAPFCSGTMTGSVTVVVNSISAGTIVNAQTLCTGGDPVAFTNLIAPSGDGVLSYQWQSNTSGCGGAWSNIPGANLATYDPPSGLAVTTYYQLVVNSTLNSVACTAASNCISVIVTALPTLFNVSGGGSYCAGDAGVPVGVSGSQLGASYQLQIGGVNTGLPVAGTGAAISFGNQTTAGTYTVIAILSGCSLTMNGSVIITIIPLPATSLIFHL